MAAVIQNTVPPQDSKGKIQVTHGLPSPEGTPDVDDERIAAELKRAQEQKQSSGEQTPEKRTGGPPPAGKSPEPQPQNGDEVDTQLKRVLACDDKEHSQILGVKDDASELERTKAWYTLGCMFHATRCNVEGAGAVYGKLKRAAKGLKVEDRFIDEVEQWNGEEILEEITQKAIDGDPDDDIDMSDDKHKKTDPYKPTPVPEPPQRVKEEYKKATNLIHHLAKQPNGPEAHQLLSEINQNIINGNEADNNLPANENNQLHTSQWTIDPGFFANQYQSIGNLAVDVLENGADYEVVRQKLDKEIKLLRDHVNYNHFPSDWAPLSTDQWINTVKAWLLEKTGEPVSKGSKDYPWPTLFTQKNDLILGTRKMGCWTQVCLEKVKEGGRKVRSNENASRAVQDTELKEYEKMGGKDLSKDQAKLSKEDWKSFRRLLWVTDSTSRNRDCCALFGEENVENPMIRLVPKSCLIKRLGKKRAQEEIDKVDEAEGIHQVKSGDSDDKGGSKSTSDVEPNVEILTVRQDNLEKITKELQQTVHKFIKDMEAMKSSQTRTDVMLAQILAAALKPAETAKA